MTTVDEIANRIAALGKRVQTLSYESAPAKAGQVISPAGPDLRPAVGVLGDLARLIVRGQKSDIKATQSAVAKLRSILDLGSAPTAPSERLTGTTGPEFLAGAAWAINEVMTARLDALDSIEALPGRQTRKNRIERLILDGLNDSFGVSPSTLIANGSDIVPKVKPYEVSRGISDMIGRSLVCAAEATDGADRRNRYFVLTQEGRRAADARQAPAGKHSRPRLPFGKTANAR